MTAVLPSHARTPSDPLAIRSAVAAARRVAPNGDFDNLAAFAIAEAVPLGIVKAILLDQIVAAHASRPGEISFQRATLAAITGAARRRA